MTIDQDLASLNAIAIVFNNLPCHAAFLEKLEDKLNDVADFLHNKGFLLASPLPAEGALMWRVCVRLPHARSSRAPAVQGWRASRCCWTGC
jgi:hypothetical protein